MTDGNIVTEVKSTRLFSYEVRGGDLAGKVKIEFVNGKFNRIASAEIYEDSIPVGIPVNRIGTNMIAMRRDEFTLHLEVSKIIEEIETRLASSDGNSFQAAGS